MSVYEPLESYLKNQSFGEVPMTFREVSGILGRPLPKSAYDHRPWWANEAAGHSHAKAWLKAGFETAQVDMAGQKLVFRRITAKPSGPAAPVKHGLAEGSHDFRSAPHSLFGALKGTFTIELGWDLTNPSLDEDELDIDKTADLIDAGLRK